MAKQKRSTTNDPPHNHPLHGTIYTLVIDEREAYALCNNIVSNRIKEQLRGSLAWAEDGVSVPREHPLGMLKAYHTVLVPGEDLGKPE